MLDPTVSQRSGGSRGRVVLGTEHRGDGTLATELIESRRVGWGFVTLYAVSCTGGALLFLAQLLVSLALGLR